MRFIHFPFNRPAPLLPKQTKDLYTDEHGNYVKERRALHLKIVNRLLKKSDPPAKNRVPNGYLIGGGTASGKSTLLDAVIGYELKKQGVKACIVDADLIKPYIPEYKHLIKAYPLDAASLVHKESKHIASLLLQRLIQQKMSFVLESTLANTNRCEAMVRDLKVTGYVLHLHIVDVPIHVAIMRSDLRGKTSGRFIPHRVIERIHRAVPRTFVAIKQQVDRFTLYDNQKELRQIASDALIIDPKSYEQFLRKGSIVRPPNQINFVLADSASAVSEDDFDDMFPCLLWVDESE